MDSEPQLTPHAAAFLAASRNRVQTPRESPREENWRHAFFDRYANEPLPRRQALSFAYSLANEPVILFPEAELVGHIYQAVPGSGAVDAGGWNEACPDADAARIIDRRVADECPDLARYNPGPDSWVCYTRCAPGHIGWHWEWILQNGVRGLLDRIRQHSTSADADGRDTLDAMRICLEAVLTWNQRHIEALELAAEAASGTGDKAALMSLRDICRRVPEHGARTFREALQSFHLSYLATIFENPHGGNGPGRLDYWLWPFLSRDLEEGIETETSARALVEELFIRFHERLMHRRDGWVETIVVGGSHADGTPSFSPLSKIMLDAIRALQISHPAVYIRLPEQLTQEVLEVATDDLIHGGNRAQVVSDAAIVTAMTSNNAMPLEDARMYMCGGCMEISPQGKNSDLLFSGFVNVPKILELVINRGHCLNTGERLLPWIETSLADFTGFPELFEAVKAELERMYLATFRLMDITAETWGTYRPRHLISAQVEDCIERGRVMHDGGARYEDVGSTPLGLPNLADSLFALKTALFERKIVSAEMLLDTLRHNFQGKEPLRRQLQQLPKYGQGNPDADRMMQRVVTMVCGIYDSHSHLFGGRIKPMIMTFRMAPVAGRALGATPDGRRASTPIAQGITPQNSALSAGITTAIGSLTQLDLTRFAGGASSMWDLDPQFARPHIVSSLLRSFVEGGGQMFQGNMTDVAELERALEAPEDYEHLLVRVGGFSARFVALEPSIQREIIARHRHAS